MAVQAHKSGLQHLVGGEVGLVSLGTFGSIMLWPVAELRALAENSGLLLPNRWVPCRQPCDLPERDLAVLKWQLECLQPC